MTLELLTLACVMFLLNKRTPASDTRAFEPNYTRIRCPICQWQPRKSDRWFCDPGCLHQWNTFDTAGICPCCGKQWDSTACLNCAGWSPHPDWYESERA
jgi:hypothetical protein